MLTLSFSSLRVRLLVLVLLAVIPALLLDSYAASERRRLATLEIQSSALRQARLVSTDHLRSFDGARQLLIALARLPEAHGGNLRACNRLFSDLLRLNPQYANLGVVDANGYVTCSGIETQEEYNLAADLFFSQATETREFAIGQHRIDPISTKASIYFGYPVLDVQDRIVSIVFAALDLNSFTETIVETQLPDEAALLIIDRQGAILGIHPDPQHWLGQFRPDEPLVQTILAQEEGTTEFTGVDGITRLFAFTPLEAGISSNSFVGVGISKEAAFSEANRVLLRNLASLGLVAFLALTAAWFGGDLFILRKINSLLNATRRLAAGDLSARTNLSYGKAELSQLAQAFDHMAEALEEREVERKRAEDEIKRHNRDLEALNNVTTAVSTSLELPEVLDRLKRVLGEQLDVPGGVIFLYDETHNWLKLEAAWGIPAAILAEFKALPAHDFPYDQVFRRKEAIMQLDFRQVEPYSRSQLSSARPNFQSYACIPLVAKGEIQGVVDMFSLSPRLFSKEELDLFTTLGQEVGVFIQNARLFDQVRSSSERLRTLSQQLLEVQENERRHISRELHDQIGQALTAVKVNLQGMSRMVDNEELSPQFDESIAILEKTLHQVRNLSLELRPSLLDDLGIVAALRWYIDRYAQRAGFKAQFSAEPSEIRLPGELETACFRVVQEALTNVVRHANAGRVDVVLRQEKNLLELSIHDNGVGFDLAAIGERAVTDRSLGLLGMRERVQLVGGQFEIHSDLASGTQIYACFPLPEYADHLERFPNPEAES